MGSLDSVAWAATAAGSHSVRMYMISVFWVSFGLAYDSPGCSCSEPRDRF